MARPKLTIKVGGPDDDEDEDMAEDLFGGGGDEAYTEEESSDRETDIASMKEFLAAVEAKDPEAMLEAWRLLPCPEMMRQEK